MFRLKGPNGYPGIRIRRRNSRKEANEEFQVAKSPELNPYPGQLIHQLDPRRLGLACSRQIGSPGLQGCG